MWGFFGVIMAISTDDFFYSATIQDLVLAVSMGQAPGFSSIDKFGESLTITAGASADITEIGGGYNFNTVAEGATIDTASSSNAGDVGQLIRIEGVRNPVNDDTSQFGWFETNGQNKVNYFDNPELTGSPIAFWRVDRMENMADEGNDIIGELYSYIDGVITAGIPDVSSTIRAKIVDGNNQTLMAVYTMRPKKVGFLFRGEAGVSVDANPAGAQNFVKLKYRSRRLGKVFKVKKSVSLMTAGTSNYQDKRSFPDIIPALTDIRLFVASLGAENLGAWGTLDILLVDESKFSREYLLSIGQPGVV